MDLDSPRESLYPMYFFNTKKGGVEWPCLTRQEWFVLLLLHTEQQVSELPGSSVGGSEGAR